MRNAYIVLLVLLITSLVQGCAYYSYSTRTAYGVQKVDIEEYLGPIDIGYYSPILSPVITFDNGVQVKFYISGAYNYPPKKTDSEYFNNARIEMFITSLKQGIQLNTKRIILDQYRIGKKTPVKLIEKNVIQVWRETSMDYWFVHIQNRAKRLFMTFTQKRQLIFLIGKQI